MLALTRNAGRVTLEDVPVPERPPGEALLRMRRAGVCDTDLQLAKGYMDFQGPLGHEFVGEVLAADDSRWIGRRVVADINAGCGRCEDCLERDGHHCQDRTVLGILNRPGAFAEQLLVPEKCLVAVPDNVPDEWAVFAEPLAAAAHVLDELPDDASDHRVAVVGDGKLGLLITWCIESAGFPVTLIGHHRNKLDLAPKARTLLESELDASVGRFPTIVEVTGTGGGLARALSLVAPRGSLILKTTVAGEIPVDTAEIVVNEVRMIGSRCGNMKRAMELLAEGKVDPSPLIAETFPLSRAEGAMDRAFSPGTLKVLIENDHA